MTYDEIIAAIVAHDVARWGECERAASERLARKNYPTMGLALNHLAHIDCERIDQQLAREAAAIMTAADRRVLRQGG